LGEIIFNDQSEKEWVEKQIHPFVRQRFEEEIKKSAFGTIVLVIPLLFEANLTDIVTEIWVVYCSYQEQIKRLMIRNNLSESEAIARIKNQLPLEEKIAKADVILDNNCQDVRILYQQIDRAILNEI
jgi:dephospho-CoA kinase